MNEENWRRYLTDYDEGLGLVYERFVLNDFLNLLRMRFNIRSVLEAPLYGMAGVSGINDVVFARHGVQVTLVDDDPERLRGVRRIWEEDLHLPAEFVAIPPTGWDRLPFADRSFDLTWQWAGLWYLADPAVRGPEPPLGQDNVSYPWQGGLRAQPRSPERGTAGDFLVVNGRPT